ncbi:WxcM-like domain-containing protein [Candidatus Nitrosopumilus sp. SW]|uniref:WxcM-like domain-containing protein n=1 Tax=Candidatus Nitrosopumilus sp. SW TaxID=2508726 RepID=UPI0011512565|nr:WxcM-like domain-containing protein [Candidatus Nitrosopumilus sp. SW]QDI88791.1 WxcM-like domain-containing protein [Candidatus Nitrosopumilus sp. SW]
MNPENIDSIKLEEYKTRDIQDSHVNGSLMVIWRDWDKIIPYEPKMIYVTNVEPGEIKGPHLHTKRTTYFVCIKGKIAFIIRKNDGTYQEIESGEDNPILVQVPKNIASAHINLSSNTSSVLVLADVAWRPNDNEMKNISFDDYDWKKWEKSNS